MKRKNLEIVVLILGVAIIGTALFFMMGRENAAESIFITNIIFSVGFLVYILYSMMTTNSLNKEIRKLNQHINSLKEEIKRMEKSLAEKDARIQQLNKDKSQLEGQLEAANGEIQNLGTRIKELEEAQTTDPND